MDLISTNKSIICIMGDHNEKLRQQLINFEGGMHQFLIQVELNYKANQHQSGGIFKLSWLAKLKSYPSVVIWIYDITEADKMDKLLDTYNELKQTLSLAKKFFPRIIIILTGKNVSGFEFNYLKKDIDLRKVFAVEFENIGQQLKRIKKMIIDDTGSFYQELYNRYKTEAGKLQKAEVNDQKLIFEIKKTLISEIENNQKKTQKHLQSAYEIITQLTNKCRDRLIFNDENQFYSSYELILQAEEYREMADQLRFKLFKNLDHQEILNQFEIHYKTFKNLISHKLFEVQEYLWRVKIFVAIIKYIEAKIQNINYNTIYNYFQTTLLCYLQLQNISEQFENFGFQQYEYEIFQADPDFIGRPNYKIRKNDQTIEIKTDQKPQIYKQIIQYRRNEVQLAPHVEFIFDIWKLYTNNLPNQYAYSNVYFKYLQILITKNFDMKSQIAETLYRFGLIEEYKNLIYQEFIHTTSPSKQIQLHSELLMYEQEKIADIKKLANELNEKLDIVIPANSFIKISKLQSDENFVQLKIEMNINQQILDLMETGILYSRNCEIEFLATNHTIIKTDKIIEKPVQIKLFGQFLDKLNITILCQDVELFQSNYKVVVLSVSKRDPPIITFQQDTAYINEINEINVDLSYKTEVQLINCNQNKDKLLKFKETMNDTINAQSFTILVTDNIIHDYVIGFRIQDEEYFKKIKFIFPFPYEVKVKQLGSVFQNAQNRNKNTLSVFSKCAIQLQVQNIELTETNFVPEVDLDFFNTNKQNVIFVTRDFNQYPKLGEFQVKYSRKNQIYSAVIEVLNINVVSYLQDVQIISPPTGKSEKAFEIIVKVKTRDPQNYFIQLKDQDKKSFFVMGKIKQIKWIDDEATFTYILFPIEIGKCNLPGIQIDIKQPNNPNQLIFDSTGMKSILILP